MYYPFIILTSFIVLRPLGGGVEGDGGGGGGTAEHPSSGGVDVTPTTLAPPVPHYSTHQPSLDYSLTGRRDVYAHMLPSAHLQGEEHLLPDKRQYVCV